MEEKGQNKYTKKNPRENLSTIKVCCFCCRFFVGQILISYVIKIDM